MNYLLYSAILFFILFVTFFVLWIVEYTSNDDDSSPRFYDRTVDGKTHAPFKYDDFMVNPTLNGGLGNQMFEIANAFAYAKRYQKDFVLDNSPKSIGKRGTYFETVFSEFQQHSKLPKVFWSVYKEPFFHYKRIGDYPSHLRLKGYFQSELYFKDHAKEVSSMFLKGMKTKSAQELFNSYKDSSSKGTIALHIRRGDYVKQSLHPVQSLSYYDYALRQIEDVKDMQLFIFSDDIEWCKETVDFGFGNKIVFVEADGLTDYEEMYMMSLCDHQIIANGRA